MVTMSARSLKGCRVLSGTSGVARHLADAGRCPDTRHRPSRLTQTIYWPGSCASGSRVVSAQQRLRFVLDGEIWDDIVMCPRTLPVRRLCRDPVVVKTAWASPGSLRNRGRSVVFAGAEDMNTRIDQPTSIRDPRCALAVRPRTVQAQSDTSQPYILLEQGNRTWFAFGSAGRAESPAATARPASAMGSGPSVVRDGPEGWWVGVLGQVGRCQVCQGLVLRS